MCIPPNNKNVEQHFEKMSQINRKFDLKELSMGMSADYLKAINYGATYIRVGSNIFGERT